MHQKLLYEHLLVVRLVEGDKNAFSEIFSIYYKDLVMFAFSLTKEMTISEEIVQETFVKLWEDHEDLEVKTSLKSLLLKSVQNRCIDWHRHNKIVNDHKKYLLLNNSFFEYNTENYLTWSELNDLVEIAMKKMPEKMKQAYEMNRKDGLKYQEIADNLSVSVRTVEVRISQALEFLRKELSDFL
jgi:RNA polymerase sigma-70 factor (ECF subfamily)